jgi:uncharacterized protein
MGEALGDNGDLSLIYRLLPDLAALGSSAALSGNLAVQAFAKGARDFRAEGGIDYQLELTNTGGAVLLSGRASARLASACDRCLAEASLNINGDVEGYFVFDAQAEELKDAEAEFALVGKDGVIDLAPFIQAAIIFELPQIVLCREDCAGICAACGADLNLEPCGCSQGDTADDHPFAALKQLL